MLSGLPVRSTMIINVPGFFMYICVVCLHEHMCLCEGGVHVSVQVYIYVCAYGVEAWGYLQVFSSIAFPLVYWGRVSFTWGFLFWLVCMGIPHLYLPYWDHRWVPMPTHLFMRVLGFWTFVLAHSQQALYAPSYLPSSRNTNSDELVFFPRN